VNPAHGIKMQYVNPATGGYPMPTIAAFLQLLPSGFESAPYRSTDATIFCVAEGRGASRIGYSAAGHWAMITCEDTCLGRTYRPGDRADRFPIGPRNRRPLAAVLGRPMTTATVAPPFRANQVGSLLRPRHLLEAREAQAWRAAGRRAPAAGRRRHPRSRRDAESRDDPSPTASSAAACGMDFVCDFANVVQTPGVPSSPPDQGEMEYAARRQDHRQARTTPSDLRGRLQVPEVHRSRDSEDHAAVAERHALSRRPRGRG
jgi:hypothetical protein